MVLRNLSVFWEDPYQAGAGYRGLEGWGVGLLPALASALLPPNYRLGIDWVPLTNAQHKLCRTPGRPLDSLALVSDCSSPKFCPYFQTRTSQKSQGCPQPITWKGCF